MMARSGSYSRSRPAYGTPDFPSSCSRVRDGEPFLYPQGKRSPALRKTCRKKGLSKTRNHVIVPTIMKRKFLPCSLLCMFLAATTAFGNPGDTFYEANLSLTRAARQEKEGDYKAALESGKKSGAVASVPENIRAGMESGMGGRQTGCRRTAAAARGTSGAKSRSSQKGGLFPETGRTAGFYPATRL